MPKTSDVESLAEQVKNLTTADKLRLAAGLIEAKRLDIAAWRLFGTALK